MRKKWEQIKTFFFAVVCFLKQTWYLGKSIFQKKHFENIEYRDLAPIDDASGCEEHIKALEWAVASGRIKNIALSGPYGSGKSSIIETFLRRNPLVRERSIKISLATFTEETDGGSVIVSENLEEGILKQLFYSIKQSKLPQSRYRKLHKIEYWPIFWKAVLFTVVALVLFFTFWPTPFSTACDLILDAGAKFYTGIKAIVSDLPTEEITVSDWVPNVTFLSFGLLSLLMLAGLARILQLFAARLSIKEIKLPADTTIGQKDSDGESIFNKNMDEIVYFFEATNFRVVFIEDLDRFKDPEIFIQLRELNTLLNSCETIRESVIFVYAIRDDMFKDAERTKFFDFIIPVIPIINSTNSGESLLEMLHQSSNDGIQHDISRGYVLDISPFISDMRILQNIYNEFVLYKATLKTGQKLTLHDEQIMSLIVFKNLYPGEFAALQAEEGIVKQAFRYKSHFIEKKKLEIKMQIDAKRDILNGIETDTLHSAQELKYAMLCALSAWRGLAYKVRTNVGLEYWAEDILEDSFDLTILLKKGSWIVHYTTNSGSTTSFRPDVPEICAPYAQRYKYLQFSSMAKQQQLKDEIETWESHIRSLSMLTMQDLIEQYGVDEVLGSDSVKANDLLVFLLRKGYINEEYAGYINFFKANSITTEDMNFILSIKNQKPLPFNYHLTKIPETLERLQIHEFGEKAILNFDLLKHMLSETHYDSQLHALFEQLSNESTLCWNFINEFIDYEKTQKYFVKRLAAAWPGLWESVYNNNALTYDRKIRYIEWLAVYTDLDTLKQQNNGNLITQFFVEHEDILQKFSAHLASRLTDIIQALKIAFIKIEISGVPAIVLDFIFENRYYELNADMIRSAVTHKNAPLAARLATQNYTVISELGYDALTGYVHDNWDLYVEEIVLAEGNTHESVDTVLALLERSIANHSLCEQIIGHEEFLVDDISRVCKNQIDDQRNSVHAIWDMLFIASKIVVSWDNVFAYWQKFGLTSMLLEYASKNYRVLSSSASECLDDDFKRAMIQSEIDLTPFVGLLSCLRMTEFNIALEDISRDKLDAMIQNRNFDFTVADYDELVAYAPELCPQYILLNQDSFVEVMDDIELTEAIFEALIMSEDMNATIKASVVKQDGAGLMTEAAAEYLSRQDIDFDQSVFYAIWEKIDDARKQEFLFEHIGILDADDFDRYFVELGDPYDKLKRTPSRHDEFLPDTPQNRKLVERLQDIQYLTSYEYEIQTQHSTKRTEKKIPVIRCRVKVNQ